MTFADVLQLTMSVFTLIGMIYAFYKFARTPHDTLAQRVSTLESRTDNLERLIDSNNNNDKEQKESIELLRECVEALIDFELAYCISTHYDAEGIDDLKHAKKILRESKKE